MEDRDQTKEELVREVQALRCRIAELEKRQRLPPETVLDVLQENLAALIDQAPTPVYVADTSGVFRLVNRAWEHLLNLRREDVLGRRKQDVFPTELSRPFLDSDREVIDKKMPCAFDQALELPQGRRHFFTIKFPLWVATGAVTAIVGISIDITKIKQAEEALRESETRFQAFMDNTPAVAFMKDAEGRYVYVNRTWERVFNKTRAEWFGKSVEEIWNADVAEQLRHNDEIVLSAGKPLLFHEEVSSPDGSHWLVVKFPLADTTGRRLVGGIALNITAQKQAEEALRDTSERLQGLSRRLLEVQEAERRHLARELHDEVGQLLTGLKLTLEMNPRLPSGAAEANLDRVLQLVKELTTRIRDLSLRLRPTMLDDLGLLPALLWHIERYRTQTLVQVRFAHHGLERRFAPDVETAAYRIVQEALTNVARHAGARCVCVSVWHEGETLSLRVEDDGVGFDAASVLHAAGSSGLSGMQERAVLLGGRLLVESRPGAGTRLLAELPAPR